MSVRVEGERFIEAPRERVFAALTDPATVLGTVPLVERFDRKDEDHWDVVFKIPLPLMPSLKLSFEVLEKRPPEHAKLRANGGSMVGGADVVSHFDLKEQSGGTLVRFHAEMSFRGALAPLEKMLEPVAQRQSQRTLDAIERKAGSGS